MSVSDKLRVGQKVKVINVVGKYPDDSEDHVVESFEGDVGMINRLVEMPNQEPRYEVCNVEQGIFGVGGFCGQTLIATFSRDELQLLS